ncbi:unnamed protein product [Ixodes hexagonus]
MADPPPRRNVSSRPHRQHLSPLQVLLQMGFPKHRAEKALAATGDRGVQLAADWLLAHVNDPTLDDSTPREYILYLCPVGPLLEQLQKYFLQSMLQCGRNGAHNYLPHITLCSFFQAPDDGIVHLTRALQHVVEKLKGELPDHIKLEHYTSQTFLGLFVAEEHNDVLKKLAVQFMREVSEFSIQVEPYLKALHITLAYQFQLEHYSVLEQLSQSIDTSASACWELRLYSRDTRIKGSEVPKDLILFLPRTPVPISLVLSGTDTVDVGTDVADAGTMSWTWESMLRTRELMSRTREPMTREPTSRSRHHWQIHRTSPLFTMHGAGMSFTVTTVNASSLRILGYAPQNPSLSEKERACGQHRRWSRWPRMRARNGMIALSLSLSLSLSRMERERLRAHVAVLFPCKSRCPRMHAHGTQRRERARWVDDDPQAESTVAHLALSDPTSRVHATRVEAPYMATAIRHSWGAISSSVCLAMVFVHLTCQHLISTLHFEDVPINVEPGLFEWLAWYPEGTPVWMTPSEFKSIGYHINTEYKPLIEAEELRHKKESIEQYYMRSFYVSQNLLKKTASEGGNVLLVGHAATLDTCTRQLTGRAPRSAADLVQLVHKIPYCGLCVAQESAAAEGSCWSLVAPPILPLTHSANTRFDWRSMLSA